MRLQFLKSTRFWKRLGIGAAMLLAVALIVNGALAWWVERQLQARVEAIRAAGEPASIAELKPAPIPDEQNAAAILQEISPRLIEYNNAYVAFYNSPIGKQYEAAENRDEAPTAEQAAAIRTILGKFADVDRALGRAAECATYAPVLDYSAESSQFVDEVLKHQTPIRVAAHFVAWQMEVDVADGHADRAVERGLQLLQLARLYESEPTLISYLVGVAIRGIAIGELYDALAAGPVSAELHAKLDAELARQDDPQRLVRALRTEGAMASGWTRWPAVEPDDVPYRRVWNGSGWPLKWYLLGVFDYARELGPLAVRPWYEVRDQFGKSDDATVVTGHGKLADLLVPAVRASFQANARGIALLRSLRIYNALRAYAEKNGHEANGLADLSLPAAATIDPFSGKPLKLKHTSEGWMVYTVMENGVDDGGDFKELKDYGVAPRQWQMMN